jgi:hypothetical protein
VVMEHVQLSWFQCFYFICGYQYIDGIMDGLGARAELYTRDVLTTDNRNVYIYLHHLLLVKPIILILGHKS